MCNGANLAYRRDAFFQTGGFSANLQYSSGDDQFIMSSIRKHYGRGAVVFSYHSLSSVGTEPEATLAGFFNQRIRWVSKSRGYRDPVVIFVGIVTWLTHFLLLTGILTGFCFPMILSLSLLLWFVKILMEYPMVWIMIRFFERKKLPRNYVIAQVFQLVYVPLAGMLGLFLPYRWKGRKG
jgi:cellulose synthase/poly-beta-1,6-N-acetylglucosamine synthase-like glycosyltransferase